jgi:hypothetical protein
MEVMARASRSQLAGALAWRARCLPVQYGLEARARDLSNDAKGESVVQALFAKSVCQACPLRSAGVGAQATRRSTTLRFPQERHGTLLVARQRQQMAAYKALYRLRPGIEGTFSQAARTTGVRRARDRRLPKTHLQRLLMAVATTRLRLAAWLDGAPLAQTRRSRLAALAAWFLVRRQYRVRDKRPPWRGRDPTQPAAA